jgi:DNA-binding MarR family transcriptional regulator
MTDRSSVSTVVDRLVESGFVERSPSSADLRRNETRITSAGRRLIAKAPAPPTARLIAAIEQLPAGQRSQLATSLSALIELLGLSEEAARLMFDDGSA